MRRRVLLLVPLALPLVPRADAASFQQNGIDIANPWAKPSVSEAAAMFTSILNRGSKADRLVAGKTPIADQVIFRDPDGSPLEYFDLLPRRPVTLRPGGRYIALRGLKGPLAVDDTFSLTLHFAGAGKVAIVVKVEEGEEE